MARPKKKTGARTAHDTPLFPPDEAFVVQFASALAGFPYVGRVEHVLSGRSARFETSEDLCKALDDIRRGVARGKRSAGD